MVVLGDGISLGAVALKSSTGVASDLHFSYLETVDHKGACSRSLSPSTVQLPASSSLTLVYTPAPTFSLHGQLTKQREQLIKIAEYTLRKEVPIFLCCVTARKLRGTSWQQQAASGGRLSKMAHALKHAAGLAFIKDFQQRVQLAALTPQEFVNYLERHDVGRCVIAHADDDRSLRHDADYYLYLSAELGIHLDFEARAILMAVSADVAKVFE